MIENFVEGQRVRYVGDMTPSAKGEFGTVIGQTHETNVNICWDDHRFNKGIGGKHWGVLPESIVLMGYDPKQTGDTDEDI